MPSPSLIAVDVGNARIKLGWFGCDECDSALPEPGQTLLLTGRSPEFDRLAAWLEVIGSDDPIAWYIGSVNRPTATRLIDWLRDHRADDPVTLLGASDLPLVVELERPDMVGVDRLLDAVAANCIRSPGLPAVVVDVGSAITVDLVSAEGAFQGGAILPGISMSARALHEFTDLLPLVDMSELTQPPPALGTATVLAMQSGLFWGAVGSVRQLAHQLTGGRESQIFLTGGAGPAVAELMGRSARHVPHLTLAGIALAARHEGLKR